MWNSDYAEKSILSFVDLCEYSITCKECIMFLDIDLRIVIMKSENINGLMYIGGREGLLIAKRRGLIFSVP